MDFTHLERLWLLLLLPVLYWLARPPRPRKRESTAHLTQWRAAMARVGRRPLRFRRLRFWLLVIAVVAMTLAAVGPEIGAVPGPRRLAIVVDGSASMAAPGVEAEARAAIDAIVAEVPDGVAVRCVFAGADPRVHDMRRDGAILLDQPLPLGGRIDLAAFVKSLQGADLHTCTISDSLGPFAQPAVGALRLVGAPIDDNVAIVAVMLDDRWPLAAVRLTIEVARFDGVDRPVDLRVVRADAEVETLRCELVAGHGSCHTEFDRGRGGELRIELARADRFPLDDSATFDLPSPPAPDVAVLGDVEADPWLLAAADILGELSGGEVLPPPAARAGFVLADGGELAELPRRAILFGTMVGTAGDSLLRDPVVVDWERADPLLAGVDLSELRVSAALPAAALPPGDPMIRSDSGVLAVAVDRDDGGRTLCFGFRLGDSNLALLPALPQLLTRAYRAAWGDAAIPRPSADNLLDRAESDLRAGPREPRPLGSFGRPGRSLVVPLLLLALLALALRIWT